VCVCLCVCCLRLQLTPVKQCACLAAQMPRDTPTVGSSSCRCCRHADTCARGGVAGILGQHGRASQRVPVMGLLLLLLHRQVSGAPHRIRVVGVVGGPGFAQQTQACCHGCRGGVHACGCRPAQPLLY
jgi:hypothetical protein